MCRPCRHSYHTHTSHNPTMYTTFIRVIRIIHSAQGCNTFIMKLLTSKTSREFLVFEIELLPNNQKFILAGYEICYIMCVCYNIVLWIYLENGIPFFHNMAKRIIHILQLGRLGYYVWIDAKGECVWRGLGWDGLERGCVAVMLVHYNALSYFNYKTSARKRKSFWLILLLLLLLYKCMTKVYIYEMRVCVWYFLVWVILKQCVEHPICMPLRLPPPSPAPTST